MMPYGGDWISYCVSMGMDPADIGLAQFPVGPGGEPVTTDMGQCYVINAATTQAKKDAAWEYIKHRLSIETLTAKAQSEEAAGDL